MSRLNISKDGLKLIEGFEGFRSRAIRLKNGKYTVGFAHSVTARDGMEVSHEQAEQLLLWDLVPIQEAVRHMVHAPLTQKQFDAIVSFVFNIGVENFRTSDVLRHINQGEPISAAIAMNAWRRAYINGKNIIIDAMVRRRAQEIAMFLDTGDVKAAAPSIIVEPLIDYSASLLAPHPSTIGSISEGESVETPAHAKSSNVAEAGVDYDVEKEFKKYVGIGHEGENNTSGIMTMEKILNKKKTADVALKSEAQEEVVSDFVSGAVSDKPIKEDATASEVSRAVEEHNGDNQSEILRKQARELKREAARKAHKEALRQKLIKIEEERHKKSLGNKSENGLEAKPEANGINIVPGAANDDIKSSKNLMKARPEAYGSATIINMPEITVPSTNIDKSKLISANDDYNAQIGKEILEKIRPKVKIDPAKGFDDETLTNGFMAGAGGIATVAGLYELMKAGLFDGNLSRAALTPNVILLELITVSGFVSLFLGAVALVNNKKAK